MELSSFNMKKFTCEIKETFCYIFKNRNSEKFLIFQETGLSYISGNETLLYCRKRTFLMFQETETLKNLYFMRELLELKNQKNPL